MASPLYKPYSCMDNSSQEMTRVILPKLSSLLSIMGSSYILASIRKKYKHDRRSIDPYQRTMIGHSIFDILFSFFYCFMGTWMTPSETGWWGAVGNVQTCSVQGFFFLMVYGVALYQFTLSLQMLLLITFMWTPYQFEVLLEKKIHLFNIVSTFVVACIPLFFGGYNPKCGTCRPVPEPYWCGEWMMEDGSEAECVRGNDKLSNAYIFLFWVAISIMTVFCTVAMISIYLSVYLQERKMVKYRFASEDDDSEEEDYKESKRIRQSLLLYTSSFYICWIIPLILWYAPHGMPYLYIIGDVLFSLMGFFNVLVYVHPRCAKYRKEYPGASLIKCYYVIFFVTPFEFAKNRTTGLSVMDGINLTFYEGLGAERRSMVNRRSMRESIDIDDACISTSSFEQVDVSWGDDGTNPTLFTGLDHARETEAGDSFLNQESALESTKELHDQCISTTHSVEVDTPLGGTDEEDAPLSAGLDQAPELEAGDSSSTVNLISATTSSVEVDVSLGDNGTDSTLLTGRDHARETEAVDSSLNQESALESSKELHDNCISTTHSVEVDTPLGGMGEADAPLSAGLDQAPDLEAGDSSSTVDLSSVVESRLEQYREAEASESSPHQEPTLEQTNDLHDNHVSTENPTEGNEPLGGADDADAPLSAVLDQARELKAGDSPSMSNLASVIESNDLRDARISTTLPVEDNESSGDNGSGAPVSAGLDQAREAEAGNSSPNQESALERTKKFDNRVSTTLSIEVDLSVGYNDKTDATRSAGLNHDSELEAGD